MIDWLISIDHQLFAFINQGLSNPVFDLVFPILTELGQFKWITFGLLPLLLVFWIWKSRKAAVLAIVGVALSVGLADSISYRIIKKNVERSRPTVEMAETAVLRTHPHSGYSFPSNHAANNFAWATYLGFLVVSWRWAFLALAATVAFSRIYVGVHFPLDVLAGALVGVMSAYFARWIMSKTRSVLSSFRERSSNP